MGDLIGGIVGGLGSVAGAVIQSQAADKAAAQALTGYNYATSGPGAAVTNSNIAAGATGTAGALDTEDTEAQLLGLKAPTPGTNSAFDNYLNSTGYDFQLKSGTAGVNANAASKGLLNSGGTGKALVKYGQDLGSSYFNNYLNQVGALNTQNTNTATLGQNSLNTVVNAGTGAGSNAAGYIAAGGNAISTGINGALGGFTNAATNYLSRAA